MIIKSYEVEKKISNLLKFNFFLLYGENNGLKKDICKIIKKSIEKKEENLETVSIYENEIIEDEENFYNSIYSGSLFSDKKILIVNNVTDKIVNQIQSVIDKKPDNTILIITSDILEKKSKLRNLFEKDKETICVPCYSDTSRDLAIIATNELKKNNLLLSQEIINLLVDKSNNDRINLKNELEKIKSYSLNKKNLDVDEIKLLINFAGEYKSENLINECLSGNILSYKKILSELYVNTINHIYFFRILSNKTQRLIDMKEKNKISNQNIDEILNSSKPPIFWKEKPIVKKQLTIWSLRDLKIIIKEINNNELLCKKNPLISKAIFFNFFTKICKKANNYSL